MADTTSIINWQKALNATYQDLIQQLLNHLPRVLGALLLLLIGWFIAQALRMLTRKLLASLDKLLVRSFYKNKRADTLLARYGQLGGDLVFWAMILFFVAASANVLEWKLISGITQTLLTYLPNLLLGLLIILVGISLGGAIRSTMLTAAKSMGLAQAELLARIAQFTFVLSATVIGVEKLGINITFLTNILLVSIGALTAGLALAFALGAKEFVANIIAAQNARRFYQVGQNIAIGEHYGRLLEISATTLMLETERGKVLVPAQLIHRDISEIIADGVER